VCAGTCGIDTQGSARQGQIDFDDEGRAAALPGWCLDHHPAADDVVVQAFQVLDGLLDALFQRRRGGQVTQGDVEWCLRDSFSIEDAGHSPTLSRRWHRGFHGFTRGDARPR